MQPPAPVIISVEADISNQTSLLITIQGSGFGVTETYLAAASPSTPGIQFDYGPRMIIQLPPDQFGFILTITETVIKAENLAPGTPYTFTVQAIDGDGVFSSPSAPSSPFTTFALTIVNNVVTGFTSPVPEFRDPISGFRTPLPNNLVIPEGVISITANLFANTTLKNIAFPKTINNIGGSCFAGCVNLESITLIDNFTPLASLVIGPFAFNRCANLVSVEFPFHLTQISSRAFSQTGLTHIAFPPNVNLIQDNAFNFCFQLATVIFQGSLPRFQFSTTQVFGTAVSTQCFLNEAITSAIVPSNAGWPAGYLITPTRPVSPIGNPSIIVETVTPGGQTVAAESVNVESLAAVQAIGTNNIVIVVGGTQSGTIAITSYNEAGVINTAVITAQALGITSIVTTAALPGPDGTFTGAQSPVVATICSLGGSSTIPDSRGSGSSVIIDLAGSRWNVNGQPLSKVIMAPSYSGDTATCYFRVLNNIGNVVTSNFSVPVTFRVESVAGSLARPSMTFRHYDEAGTQRPLGTAPRTGSIVQDGGKQYATYTITLTDNDGIQGTPDLGGAPSEPRNVTATSVSGGIDLSWDAPIVGESITYSFTTSPGGAQFFTKSYTYTASVRIPEVQPKTAYTFTVTASNTAGSTSADPTPPVEVGGPPGSPTSVAVVASTTDTTSAIISWFAPTMTGGADITSYSITSSLPGVTFSDYRGTGTPNQFFSTATGLIPGTTYTFSVAVTNSYGTSPAAPSSPFKVFKLTIVDNTVIGFVGTVPENLVIPDGITRISEEVFSYQPNIKTVQFPFSIAVIGHGAFAGTDLTTVTFPPNIVQVGFRAFLSCRSLTTVVFQGSRPAFIYLFGGFPGFHEGTALQSESFIACPSLTSATVPANAGWAVGYQIKTGLPVTISSTPIIVPLVTPSGEPVNATIADVRSLAAVQAVPANTTVVAGSGIQSGTIAVASPNTGVGIASAVVTAATSGITAILTTPVLPGPNGTFTGTQTPVVATICVAAAGSTAVVPDSGGTESSVTVDLAGSRDSNGEPIKAVIIVPSYAGSTVTCYFRVIDKNGVVITSGFRVPVTFKLEFSPRATVPPFMDIVHYDDFGNGTDLGRAERTTIQSGGAKSYGFYTLVLTKNDGFQGAGGQYKNEGTFRAFRPRSSSELLSLQKRQVEQSLNTVPSIRLQDSSEQTARIRKFASVMPNMPLHGNSATLVSFKASSVVQSMIGGQAYRNAASQYRTPTQYTTPGCSNILDNFMRVDLGAPSNPKVIPCTSVISKAAPQVVPFNPVVDLPLRKNDNKVVVKSARTNTAGCGANQ